MNAPTVIILSRIFGGIADCIVGQVDQRPAGARLNVADLARQVGMPQRDMLVWIEALVRGGRLDQQTLRATGAAMPSAAVKTGVRKVRAYCQQPDACVAGVKGPCRLCHAKHPPVPAAPVQPVSPEEPAKAPVGDSTPPAGAITIGQQLADRLCALIRAKGLSKTRVSQHLFAIKGGIEGLRRRNLKPATVERIETFLAAMERETAVDVMQDMLEQFRPARKANAPAVQRPPRVSDPAPQGSLAAARARRSIGRQAVALLDGDKSALSTGGHVPQAVRGAMNNIIAQRAAADRLADPVEQAKLALRQRGRVVFDASVDGGRHGRFFVSGVADDQGKRQQLTKQELIALAWRVNPLRMKQLTGKEKAA